MTEANTNTGEDPNQQYEIEWAILNRCDEEGFHHNGSIHGTRAQLRQQIVSGDWFEHIDGDMECSINCTFDFPDSCEYSGRCIEPTVCPGAPSDEDFDKSPTNVCANCLHRVAVWYRISEPPEVMQGSPIEFWGCKYCTVKTRWFRLAPKLVSSDKLKLVPPFELEKEEDSDSDSDKESCAMGLIYCNTNTKSL